jgi:hypothetical protein
LWEGGTCPRIPLQLVIVKLYLGLSMKAKTFFLACLAQVIAMITSLPFLFFASVAAWGDQCNHNGYSSCDSRTVFGGLLYITANALLAVIIGRLLLKRFASYSQATIRAFIVVIIIEFLLIVPTIFPASFLANYIYTSTASIIIGALCIYPVYTLLEYTYRATARKGK